MTFLELETRGRTSPATINPACMSYYLGLRHLPFPDMSWIPGFGPRFPAAEGQRVEVATSDELLDALVARTPRHPKLGVLLSGGIDSAILAALVAPGTRCFTIAFDAPGAIDESGAAAEYAAHWGHPHTVIRIRWSDYLANINSLFSAKHAPLHAIEVPLHLAALAARDQGVTELLVGNGADSTFGGMDKLLAVDWSFDEFVTRYQFADPAALLANPIDLATVFEPYRVGEGVDVQRFLHEVHGQGIVAAFENSIGTAGVAVCAPYEALAHRGPLDIERIRAGEPKYLVQEAFRLLYDTSEAPAKVPFARPMDIWFQGWDGVSSRPEFCPGSAAALARSSGEARWLAWCLGQFCDYLDQTQTAGLLTHWDHETLG